MSSRTTPLNTPAAEQVKAIAGALATLVGTLIGALLAAGVPLAGWHIGLVVVVAAALAWLVIFYLPNRDDSALEAERVPQAKARNKPGLYAG
jgi:MFS family permease